MFNDNDFVNLNVMDSNRLNKSDHLNKPPSTHSGRFPGKARSQTSFLQLTVNWDFHPSTPRRILKRPNPLKNASTGFYEICLKCKIIQNKLGIVPYHALDWLKLFILPV